jgi:SNF2 family DNA or RNA helicase
MDENSGSSSKLDWLVSFIENGLLHDEKVVVFSAYLPLLRAAMQRLQGWRPGIALCITGEAPAAERQEAVSTFQSGASARVLLISMGVGAEGLTLTRANHVVFLNEWWNPSLNQQARDRVIRIGQHREVKEYRLIIKDSIEQRIRDIVIRKQCTFEQIVDAE